PNISFIQHAVCADICVHSAASREDKVIQPGGEVIAAEGDFLTLNCTFETSDTFPTLFWYKQESSSSPQFLIKEYSDETEKFSVKHDKQQKEFHVQISSAAVTDSAVYYCAVTPTVTGNNKTLYKILQRKHKTTTCTKITTLHNIH
uniref:Ig-like domain-containing protein n=1 Tax=Oryzias latipes TaxID=8090 RepID=A0A3B3HF02_ORYLA